MTMTGGENVQTLFILALKLEIKQNTINNG